MAFPVAMSQPSAVLPSANESDYQPLTVNYELIRSRVSHTHPVARSLILVGRGGVELPGEADLAPMQRDEHFLYTLHTLPEIERMILDGKRAASTPTSAPVGPAAALHQFVPAVPAPASPAAANGLLRRPATMQPANVMPAPAPRPRSASGIGTKSGRA